MSRGKALILGDDTRSFLAIVRGLGRQGISVHAAPANFRSPALRSRYIAAQHDLPPWLGDGSAWLVAMTTLLERERFDLVIPCNETTLLPLQRHRRELEILARLAIPDDEAITALFDKSATRELAQRLGVPVAHGRLLEAHDTVGSILREFGTPVVIKPRNSFVLSALASRGKAVLEDDTGRLEKAIHEAVPDQTILEQYFAGRGLGVSLLASQGRLLQAFQHDRVRELAGASFYRVSAALNPTLVKYCKAIVAAVGYTGVAMFEFRLNQNGDAVLLEINARPWGSMPLPLALGINFPYRWFRLLTAGDEIAPVPYRTGVYGRNLVADLHSWFTEATELRLGRPARIRFFARRCGELIRALTGREVFDVLVHDDVRPGVTEFREIGAGVWRRLLRGLPGAVERRQRQALAIVKKVGRCAGSNPRLVFVCHGNICRSPFAAALLRVRLGTESSLVIESAGVMPRIGRVTPLMGQEAAHAFGIDLADHRSAWLERQQIDAASLIIVFDDNNRNALLDRYPTTDVPVIRLGDLDRSGEIGDPIDGGPAAFGRCYEHIAASLSALARALDRSSA